MSHSKRKICLRKATRPLPSMGCADRDAPRKALSKPAAFVVLCKGLTLKTELTAERLRELLHYNPETGVFTWLVHRQRHRAGDVAGSKHSMGYIEMGVCGSSYLAHRLAWLYMTGAWPAGDVDHKNGQRSDNRFDNLRDVSKSVNLQNRQSAPSNSLSGLLGVSRSAARKERWTARIQGLNGRPIHLGSFDTPQEAHHAYLEMKRSMHEGCTI